MSRSRTRGASATAFAVSLFALAATAKATVVCTTPPSPISVPNSFAGIYINLITGATGSTGSGTTGWDWNPYNSGTGLSFFFNNSVITGGAVATASVYDVLGSGVLVSAASTYTNSTALAATANWRAGSTGQYVGIRFYNEGTATTNYGWIRFDTTGPTGFAATIQSWCYEDAGAGITTGSVPVELQSFSVE